MSSISLSSDAYICQPAITIEYVRLTFASGCLESYSLKKVNLNCMQPVINVSLSLILKLS